MCRQRSNTEVQYKRLIKSFPSKKSSECVNTVNANTNKRARINSNDKIEREK